MVKSIRSVEKQDMSVQQKNESSWFRSAERKVGAIAVIGGTFAYEVVSYAATHIQKVTTVFPVHQDVPFTVDGNTLLMRGTDVAGNLLFTVNDKVTELSTFQHCMLYYPIGTPVVSGQCQASYADYVAAQIGNLKVAVDAHAYPVIESATRKIMMGVTVTTTGDPLLEVLRAVALGLAVGGLTVLGLSLRDRSARVPEPKTG